MTHPQELQGTSVLTIRASLYEWSNDTEAKVWEELVVRCESQQLYIGGSLETAVIYSVNASRLARQLRLLRNWLLSHIAPESFEVRLSDLGWLTTPTLRHAAIESVAGAQLYLLEHGLAATHAFASIRQAGAVQPHAHVSEDGRRLDITLPKQQLVVTLQRMDGTVEPIFQDYRGGMRAGELHALVMKWHLLEWEPLPPDSDLRAGDRTAKWAPCASTCMARVLRRPTVTTK